MAIAIRNSVYKEDISTLAVGTTVVAQPCRVWDITVSTEGAGDSVVSFSNSEGYSSTTRLEKVILTDEIKTVHLVFPEGKDFSTGLSATSNLAGVDVSVTYD